MLWQRILFEAIIRIYNGLKKALSGPQCAGLWTSRTKRTASPRYSRLPIGATRLAQTGSLLYRPVGNRLGTFVHRRAPLPQVQ